MRLLNTTRQTKSSTLWGGGLVGSQVVGILGSVFGQRSAWCRSRVEGLRCVGFLQPGAVIWGGGFGRNLVPATVPIPMLEAVNF